MASKPCAVCKILKETCAPGCTTAPHFPSGDTRFKDVHEIFGAANVREILNNLGSVKDREIAVNSLCYAAEARLRDPISGIQGMEQLYESILNDVKSEANELETKYGSDLVPKYFDLPMPDDFLTTPGSLDSYIEKIKNLPTIKKNEIMKLLKGGSQNMGDGHGSDGASTSAGPSTDLTLGRKHQ